MYCILVQNHHTDSFKVKKLDKNMSFENIKLQEEILEASHIDAVYLDPFYDIEFSLR